MKDDEAVAGVVTGILLLAALVAFVTVVNATWVPVWVENQESSQAAAARAGLGSWADSMEDRGARGLVQSSQGVAIPLGVKGLPVLGAGASSGSITTRSAPNLTVSVGGVTVLDASGSVAVASASTRFPSQEQRYTLGAMETRQHDGAWVELRTLLAVERVAGGKLNLSVRAVQLTGAPQDAVANGEVQLEGTVTGVTRVSPAGGDVRVIVAGVPADAWRDALNRTFAASSLAGRTAPDCAAVAGDYCFPAATNTPTQVDVVVRQVGAGWTATRTSVAVSLAS